VAASYQRVERSHPGRILIGLGSSRAGMTQGQEYRPYQKMVSYLDELDALSPTVPTDRRVLAALGPKMLRLAAERSAGVHPYLVTPAHTKKARDNHAAGADHVAIQVLTAGDYGHGSLLRQQWRELAAALTRPFRDRSRGQR
jgi:hypothetical protein